MFLPQEKRTHENNRKELVISSCIITTRYKRGLRFCSLIRTLLCRLKSLVLGMEEQGRLACAWLLKS
jgi:hypothetical protein